MALTDVQVRQAKPKDKPYKLTDERGLHLYITPAGSRLWRYRYEIAGKEQLLSFGPYPEVTLSEARGQRDEARQDLRDGKNPAVERHLRKLKAVTGDDAFETIAREWHASRVSGWTPTHASDVITSLERDVFPTIGRLKVDDISPPIVLSVIRAVERRGANHTAVRIQQRISQVFVYGIATGRAKVDPAAVIRDAMAPLEKGRQPAITELEPARAVLRSVETLAAFPLTKLAHRLLALTAGRPGDVRGARHAEFHDLDTPAKALWWIPAERMKMKRDHIVPLAPATIEVVKAAIRLSPSRELLFPNPRRPDQPTSENAIGYLLNRAGYHHHHVPHGWRSTFSSVMNERHPKERQVIDLMLSHVKEDEVEGAYNRALHLDRRRALAVEWAGLLLEGAAPLDEVLGGPRKRRPLARQ